VSGCAPTPPRSARRLPGSKCSRPRWKATWQGRRVQDAGRGICHARSTPSSERGQDPRRHLRLPGAWLPVAAQATRHAVSAEAEKVQIAGVSIEGLKVDVAKGADRSTSNNQLQIENYRALLSYYDMAKQVAAVQQAKVLSDNYFALKNLVADASKVARPGQRADGGVGLRHDPGERRHPEQRLDVQHAQHQLRLPGRHQPDVTPRLRCPPCERRMAAFQTGAAAMKVLWLLLMMCGAAQAQEWIELTPHQQSTVYWSGRRRPCSKPHRANRPYGCTSTTSKPQANGACSTRFFMEMDCAGMQSPHARGDATHSGRGGWQRRGHDPGQGLGADPASTFAANAWMRACGK
jgi:hypothetical protein